MRAGENQKEKKVRKVKGITRHRGTGLKIRYSTHLVDISGGLYIEDKEKIMWHVCPSVCP